MVLCPRSTYPGGRQDFEYFLILADDLGASIRATLCEAIR